jgi:hypothetical protein
VVGGPGRRQALARQRRVKDRQLNMDNDILKIIFENYHSAASAVSQYVQDLSPVTNF